MQQLPNHFNKIIFILIASIPFSVFAGTDISMELYKEKKYEEAFQYFNELAEVGNAQAMYNIGIMYFKGEGVKRDLPRAYAWMSVANEKLPKEEYKQTAGEIFNTLFESEQKTAKELTAELNARFNAEEVNKNLAPEPLSDKDCTQDAIPVRRKNPQYPAIAISKGLMGTVIAEFTISPQGYVRDLIITPASSPEFAKASVDAISHWRYYPRVENSKAVPKLGTRARLIFLIDESGQATNKRAILSELNIVRDKANAGDAAEQYKYALMLDKYKMFQSFLKGINLEYQEANKWYLASAVGGLTNAQFYLGRNMAEGFGCKIDEQRGTKWIRSAAIGGYSPAQRFLAVKMISDPDEQKYREAIKFLKYSVDQDDYYPAKILLAWEYATSFLDDVRNGQAALDLLKSEAKDYYDPVRIKETEAAAYAETGDYAMAVHAQDNALEEAKKYGWDIAEMHSRLESYKENKPWRGEYYVSISPPPKIETPDVPDNLKKK